MTLLLTEIDFVGQGNQPDGVARSYEKHLATAVQEAVKTLSLRTNPGLPGGAGPNRRDQGLGLAVTPRPNWVADENSS